MSQATNRSSQASVLCDYFAAAIERNAPKVATPDVARCIAALDELESLRRSADAALEAVGGELERTKAQYQDLLERAIKVAIWYGHDLEAAVGKEHLSRAGVFPPFDAQNTGTKP